MVMTCDLHPLTVSYPSLSCSMCLLCTIVVVLLMVRVVNKKARGICSVLNNETCHRLRARLTFPGCTGRMAGLDSRFPLLVGADGEGMR